MVVRRLPSLEHPTLRDLIVAECRLLRHLVGVLIHALHSLGLLVVRHTPVLGAGGQVGHQPERCLSARLRVGQVLRAGQIDALTVHVEVLVSAGDEHALLARGLVQPLEFLLHGRLLDGRGIAGTEQLIQDVLCGGVGVLLRSAPCVKVRDLRAGDVVQAGDFAGDLAGELLPEVRHILVLVHVGGHALVVDGAVDLSGQCRHELREIAPHGVLDEPGQSALVTVGGGVLQRVIDALKHGHLEHGVGDRPDCLQRLLQRQPLTQSGGVEVRAQIQRNGLRCQPVQRVAVTVVLQRVFLMPHQLPELLLLVVVRRLADQMTHRGQRETEQNQRRSSEGLRQSGHNIRTSHVGLLRGRDRLVHLLTQLAGLVDELRLGKVVLCHLHCHAEDVQRAVLQTAQEDVGRGLAERQDALADEVQCLLDGIALGVLLPQQPGKCVSEGIGVTVGRLRRVLDGLEPGTLLQLRGGFVPRGVVGLHEAGKGVGVGEGAEHKVALIHRPVGALAPCLQRLGLEDAPPPLHLLIEGVAGGAVVVLAAAHDDVRVLIEHLLGLLEGGTVIERRSGTLQLATGNGVDQRLHEAGGGFLHDADGLETEVAHHVSDLGAEVAQHRGITPRGELVHRRGGYLVGDVLVDLLQRRLPFCVGLGVAVLYQQDRVDLNTLRLHTGLLRPCDDLLVHALHAALNAVQLAHRGQLLDELTGLQYLSGAGENGGVVLKDVNVKVTACPVIVTSDIQQQCAHSHRCLVVLAASDLLHPLGVGCVPAVAAQGLLGLRHRRTVGLYLVGQLAVQHSVLDVLQAALGRGLGAGHRDNRLRDRLLTVHALRRVGVPVRARSALHGAVLDLCRGIGVEARPCRAKVVEPAAQDHTPHCVRADVRDRPDVGGEHGGVHRAVLSLQQGASQLHNRGQVGELTGVVLRQHVGDPLVSGRREVAGALDLLGSEGHGDGGRRVVRDAVRLELAHVHAVVDDHAVVPAALGDLGRVASTQQRVTPLRHDLSAQTLQVLRQQVQGHTVPHDRRAALVEDQRVLEVAVYFVYAGTALSESEDHILKGHFQLDSLIDQLVLAHQPCAKGVIRALELVELRVAEGVHAHEVRLLIRGQSAQEGAPVGDEIVTLEQPLIELIGCGSQLVSVPEHLLGQTIRHIGGVLLEGVDVVGHGDKGIRRAANGLGLLLPRLRLLEHLQRVRQAKVLEHVQQRLVLGDHVLGQGLDLLAPLVHGALQPRRRVLRGKRGFLDLEALLEEVIGRGLFALLRTVVLLAAGEDRVVERALHVAVPLAKDVVLYGLRQCGEVGVPVDGVYQIAQARHGTRPPGVGRGHKRVVRHEQAALVGLLGRVEPLIPEGLPAHVHVLQPAQIVPQLRVGEGRHLCCGQRTVGGRVLPGVSALRQHVQDVRVVGGHEVIGALDLIGVLAHDHREGGLLGVYVVGHVVSDVAEDHGVVAVLERLCHDVIRLGTFPREAFAPQQTFLLLDAPVGKVVPRTPVAVDDDRVGRVGVQRVHAMCGGSRTPPGTLRLPGTRPQIGHGLLYARYPVRGCLVHLQQLIIDRRLHDVISARQVAHLLPRLLLSHLLRVRGVVEVGQGSITSVGQKDRVTIEHGEAEGVGSVVHGKQPSVCVSGIGVGEILGLSHGEHVAVTGSGRVLLSQRRQAEQVDRLALDLIGLRVNVGVRGGFCGGLCLLRHSFVDGLDHALAQLDELVKVITLDKILIDGIYDVVDVPLRGGGLLRLGGIELHADDGQLAEVQINFPPLGLGAVAQQGVHAAGGCD